MTSTRTAAIRTDADALAWIETNRPTADVRGDHVQETATCGRCGGSGIYSHYHGACFACGGTNSTTRSATPLVVYARRERTNDTNRARAAKKAAARAAASVERQRDWCEANGFGRLTFDEKNELVAERRKVEQIAKRGVAPEGRFEFTGRVVKLEERSDFTGRGIVLKATIVVTSSNGTEWLAWGTAPRSLFDDEGFDKGAVVKLTATVTQGREAHFAFFKRPAKAELVTAAPVAE